MIDTGMNMDAEEVVEKILADARGQAEKIKAEAKEKEAAELAELNEQLDEYKKQTEILAEKAGQDKKAHLLAAARMEIAKDFLAEKRKLLHEVFEQAQTQLQNRSKPAMKRSSSIITKGGLTISSSSWSIAN
jgi:vacuolar-type H+-ATPase subunit E/Vma4